MCGAVGEEVEWRWRGREGLGHVESAEFEVSVSSSGRVKANGRQTSSAGLSRALEGRYMADDDVGVRYRVRKIGSVLGVLGV